MKTPFKKAHRRNLLNVLGAIAALTMASVIAPVSGETLLAQDAAQPQLASTDIEDLVEESNLLFQSGKTFDALLIAIKAAQRLKQENPAQDQSALSMKTAIALRDALYEVKEYTTIENAGNVTFSPDGETFAFSGSDGTVKLWNREGEELNTLDHGGSYVDKVVFSPDGKTLASAGYDGKVKLWNLQGDELKTLDHGSPISKVVFSPDGETIATGGYDDEKVKLWNLQGENLATLDHDGSLVSEMMFSPDGETFASSGYYGKVKLWNLQGENLNTLNHGSHVEEVMFSPDGKTLVSRDTDGGTGTLKLWNLEGEEPQALGHGSDSINQAVSNGNGTDQLSNLDLDDLLSRSCKWVQHYLVLRPQDLEEFTICQTPDLLAKSSRYWLPEGDAAAGESHIEKAIAIYNLVLEWNPNLGFDPATRAQQEFDKKTEAPQLVRSGEDFAREGKIDETVEQFQAALNLNSNIDLDPYTLEIEQDAEMVAKGFAAFEKVNEGEYLALEGKIDEAILVYQEALNLNPSVDLYPQTLEIVEQNAEAIAKNRAAVGKVSRGESLTSAGKIDETILAYEEALNLDPNIEISAYSWASLCLYGSLYGYADKVLFAGETAVSLEAFNLTSAKLARGLARALTDDIVGATNDFEFVIQDQNFLEELPEGFQITQWLDTLKNGDNPFTPEVLEVLKNELELNFLPGFNEQNLRPSSTVFIAWQQNSKSSQRT